MLKKKFSKFLLILKIVPRLGILDILNVLIFKTGVKLGFHKVCKLVAGTPKGTFFILEDAKIVNAEVVENWETEGILFSYHLFPLRDEPPNWLHNQFNNTKFTKPLKPWWNISDFDEEIGDIKTIWELSRMDWLLAFAQKSRNGDKKSISKLNSWIEDWVKENPPYLGPNWKCGQEASIRVINLICSLKILSKKYIITPSLKDLIILHLDRIYLTTSYSKAQKNNHATSEGCALLIGGAVLNKNGYKDGYKYQLYGKRMLEKSVSKLIQEDGSFSQYSLNYHRLMIDTLSIAEMVTRDLSLEKFNKVFYKKASAASNWLFQMVDNKNGYVPNIGHNDGARLLQLTNSDYLDYRQSVHLSMNLFNDKLAYTHKGYWNKLLQWLNIKESSNNPPNYLDFDSKDGGFLIKRAKDSKLILRYPRFAFRPSQSDVLHLDFWLKGKNLFRDGGTYSYNASNGLSDYFSGVSSHNTVQFDNRDQMPKISRFLFGEWIRSSNFEETNQRGYKGHKISYQDSYGCFHERFFYLNDKELIIFDQFSGFKDSAILRWRLPQDKWKVKIEKNYATKSNDDGKLTISSEDEMSIKVVNGLESKYYLKKSKVKVMEILVKKSSAIKTSYKW